MIDSRRDWIELADFLAEHHDERVVVLSSPDLRNQVLSSSALVMELSRYHAKRMMSGSGLSQSEAQERIEDHFGFWSDDYALLDKVAVLDRHGVDYLLYSSAYDEVMQPIYAVDGLLVERLFAWEMFRLARVG
ncbi:MAG: hypothetical protein OXE46_12685 [Chloroflexi bacterium]|nr:hypothetical protein [Chloroflexota bacterium]